jgi:hypothetical protein
MVFFPGEDQSIVFLRLLTDTGMGIDNWARFMLQRVLISWQFRTKRLFVSGYYEILIIAGVKRIRNCES